MQVNVEWGGKMRFVGKGAGESTVVMDAPQVVGGEDNGFRPKELLLNGLAGCTAMDVLSILRKMRCEPEAFRIEVSAKQTTEHPKVLTAFHIKYIIRGEVPTDKLEKAIKLSQEQYCGVTTMFRQFAEISHEYIFE